jgi:hypothetical protein
MNEVPLITPRVPPRLIRAAPSWLVTDETWKEPLREEYHKDKKVYDSILLEAKKQRKAARKEQRMNERGEKFK